MCERKKESRNLQSKLLAGAPGFEPGIAGPKPAALPLGYAPSGSLIACGSAPAPGAGTIAPLPSGSNLLSTHAQATRRLPEGRRANPPTGLGGGDPSRRGIRVGRTVEQTETGRSTARHARQTAARAGVKGLQYTVDLGLQLACRRLQIVAGTRQPSGAARGLGVGGSGKIFIPST